MRRVWQSNPYQQVRTSPDTYEFVACASSLVNFGADSGVHRVRNFSSAFSVDTMTDPRDFARFHRVTWWKIYRFESNRFATRFFFFLLLLSLLLLFGVWWSSSANLSSLRGDFRPATLFTARCFTRLDHAVHDLRVAFIENEPAARNELSIPLSNENAVSPQTPFNSLFPQSETSLLFPPPSSPDVTAKSVSRPSKRKGKKRKTVSKRTANRKCIGRAVFGRPIKVEK